MHVLKLLRDHTNSICVQKKKKSVSDDTYITDDMADLCMQETSHSSITTVSPDEDRSASESPTQTPKSKGTKTFNIGDQASSSQSEYSGGGVPLEDEAIASVKHIEYADLPMSPDSKDSLEVDVKTISQMQFEVFDCLEKHAEDVVSRQAELLFRRMFNEKVAAEQATIKHLKEEVRHIAQLYSEKSASGHAEIARLRALVAHNSKLREEELSGRARMNQTQEDVKLLEMKPSLSQVDVLDKEWELAMLQRRTRNLIRVGEDGSDEFVKMPFSEQCYVDIAREIFRRFRPEDECFHGCYPSDSDYKPEMTSDFNLGFLSLLSKQPDPEDIESVSSCYI